MIQTSVGLKLEGATLRTGLRAAAAAAASASCLASRRAALLFVRGGIFGAAMLLGRGLALAAATVVLTFSEATAEGLALALVGRIAATEAARLTGYPEGVAFTDASCDAGRGMGSRGGLKESFEFVRENAGVLGATGARNMNEVGGPCSLETRKAALLFDLGANVGAFTLATAIDSRRLCPGTPSKSPVVPCLEFSWFVNALFLITWVGGACPSLRDAARVIRGAMAGGAVDATEMVLIRLCPGTLANVCARRSLDTGPRGTLSTA